ncbi:hypothetical protein BCEN4_1790004 [Burkholderia cenocepacia]|nr:hypothetical protein BCEN4_1790004 [Burkholderia cenocepacia]
MAAHEFAAVRRPRSRAVAFSRAVRRSARRDLRILPADRRRDRAVRECVQAADRVLRRASRGRPARAADRAHPSAASGPAGDPRREARRHRQHGRAVRARSVRALSRGRRHGEPVHGLRLGRAVLRARRQGRDRAVPHVEPGRLGPAVPRYQRPAAVSGGRRPRGEQVERAERPARPRGRRDVPEGNRDRARDRRRHAALDPRHRRAGRRRAGDRQRRPHGRRHRDDDQLVACDPVREQGRGFRRSRGARRAEDARHDQRASLIESHDIARRARWAVGAGPAPGGRRRLLSFPLRFPRSSLAHANNFPSLPYRMGAIYSRDAAACHRSVTKMSRKGATPCPSFPAVF